MPTKLTPRLPWPRSAPDDPSVQLGVDVVRRRGEIEAIVKAYFSETGIPKGCPSEDFIQEVILKIVQQNRLKGVYDPRKSSFSHYIWMVASNVRWKIERSNRAQKRIPDHLICSMGDRLVATSQRYEINMPAMLDIKRRMERGYS